MAERDMGRDEVAKATSHAGEMQQEITLLRDDQEQVSSLTVSLISLMSLLLIIKWKLTDPNLQCLHLESFTLSENLIFSSH